MVREDKVRVRSHKVAIIKVHPRSCAVMVATHRVPVAIIKVRRHSCAAIIKARTLLTTHRAVIHPHRTVRVNKEASSRAHCKEVRVYETARSKTRPRMVKVVITKVRRRESIAVRKAQMMLFVHPQLGRDTVDGINVLMDRES